MWIRGNRFVGRHKMLLWQRLLCLANRVRDMPVPGIYSLGVDFIIIGLIRELIVEVIEGIQCLHNLPHHRHLSLYERGIGECLKSVPPYIAHTLDVVWPIQRGEVPLIGLVLIAEEDHIIFQPTEIGLVPSIEIELVTTIMISWNRAPRPRRNQTIGPGRERAFRVHPGGLCCFCHKRPHKEACQVHPVGVQGLQIREVVEVEVDHHAIVRSGGDEHDRLATKEQVMRVVRMEPKRAPGFY